MIDTTTVNIDTDADGDTEDTGGFKTVTVLDTSEDTNWEPIGDCGEDSKCGGYFATNDAIFTASFGGAGHKLTNLWVRKESNSAGAGVYAGLFGITRNATIKNLGIENGSVFSSSLTTSVSGGLAGAMSGSSSIARTNYYVDSDGPSGVGVTGGGSMGCNDTICVIILLAPPLRVSWAEYRRNFTPQNRRYCLFRITQGTPHISSGTGR